MPGHISGNATWTETASTPVRAANLENIEAVLDQNPPFAGLRTGKLAMTSAEYVTVAAGAEYTLATITGPGVIRSIWMALGGGSQVALDGRIRVYYDGASTPTIDIDCGTLFAMHWGGGATTGTHQTPHLSAQLNSVNYNAAYMLLYPMPFGTSISIRYYNVGTQTATFFHMVTYNLTASDAANGLRFRIAGVRYADQVVTLGSGQSAALLNWSGGPGWVVGMSYVGGVSATDLSWMERNFSFTIDGESTPSIVATGTEDWFDSGWYFNSWRDFQSSFNSYVGTDAEGAAGTANQYAAAMTTDLWSKWGGVPFNSSCACQLTTDPHCDTTQQFVYCIMYYA